MAAGQGSEGRHRELVVRLVLALIALTVHYRRAPEPRRGPLDDG